MDKYTPAVGDDLSPLPEHAGVLVAGTAAVAAARAGNSREKFAAALEGGREIYSRARKQAIRGAKVADLTVRENPYQAVGIALGVGALIGYLVSRRRARNGD